jgi:CelD/BcsL family acetyltransferase involved in cellulose biosynthesis
MGVPLIQNRASLECTELRSAEGLEAIAREWRDLWNRSRGKPFQSPMWLVPWARAYTGKNLLVLTMRCEGRLVAVVPFYLWREELFLLGNGISDYLDSILDPAFETEILGALEGWLESQSCAQKIRCSQLPVNSPLLRIEPRTFSRSEGNGDPCPVLNLSGCSEADFAPRKQLEKLRYYQRRAAKEGRINFERAEEANCGEYLGQLFELHQARWAEAGGGVLADDGVQEFHREAVSEFANSGNLRLYRMTLDSKVIAVLYAFADARNSYYYLSGFDPRYENLSPGTLIIGHAIERAIRESHQTFNFLRGQESYKYAWGAVDTETRDLILSKAQAASRKRLNARLEE